MHVELHREYIIGVPSMKSREMLSHGGLVFRYLARNGVASVTTREIEQLTHLYFEQQLRLLSPYVYQNLLLLGRQFCKTQERHFNVAPLRSYVWVLLAVPFMATMGTVNSYVLNTKLFIRD